MKTHRRLPVPSLLTLLLLPFPSQDGLPQTDRPVQGLRTQRFDTDPGWEGHNNRAAERAGRSIQQDFGYSKGRIGGLITPAAEPAYYATKTPRLTFDTPLKASGRIVSTGPKFHLLLGFFNAGSLGAWRTPNTVCLRLIGRGDYFYAYLEYATSRFRAGGDSPRGFLETDPTTGKLRMAQFKNGEAPHRWSLSYDPAANNGNGSITATIDDVTAVCDLGEGHRKDGAEFKRFGMLNVMKSVDDAGELWMDDLSINGASVDLKSDPKWEGVGNRRSYVTKVVRPAWDAGYSPTGYAGGAKSGEMGGLVFRGDGRYAEKMASYADKLEPLTLDKPLHASGRIALRWAASDSTTMIGFFHSRDSLAISESQKSSLPMPFLGAAVEGPSPDGFYLYPVLRTLEDVESRGRGPSPPAIFPDGSSTTWSLDYTPPREGKKARITVKLGAKESVIEVDDLKPGSATRFDRFGLLSTRIDGNGQRIYFDDLIYTFRQP